MKKNMGTIDRAVRFLLAIVVIGLFAAGQISGIAAIILLVFASIFIITSFIGFCPLYVPFGFKTTRAE